MIKYVATSELVDRIKKVAESLIVLRGVLESHIPLLEDPLLAKYYKGKIDTYNIAVQILDTLAANAVINEEDDLLSLPEQPKVKVTN